MPYIKQSRRDALFNDSVKDRDDRIKTPGELNFMLTELIKDYVKMKKLSYQTINDIVGALESTKLEFYRRIAVPYENSKISENGDVY